MKYIHLPILTAAPLTIALVLTLATGCTSAPPAAAPPTTSPPTPPAITPPSAAAVPTEGLAAATSADSRGALAATATPEVAMTSPKGEIPRDHPAVKASINVLADTAHVAPGDIHVVSFESVTWNDSSLGCSSPGQMYLQVLTPGFRVVLETGGVQSEYHTSGGEHPVVVSCGAGGGLGAPGSTPGKPGGGITR